MGYREELITIIEKFTENAIDITDNWSEWEDFLTEQGYIRTYKQIYQMELDHLTSNGHDYSDKFINKDGTWNVKKFIKEDNDITKMENGCYFVHNQRYIDDYIIDLFYEQQRFNYAINQALIDLHTSIDAFSRFDALLFVLAHKLGDAKIYLHSSMRITIEESLKCINEVLMISNQYFGDVENSIGLWMPKEFKTDSIEHYCDLIRFGGYSVFYIGEDIMNADVIILHEEQSNAMVHCYTYSNINELCDYIAEQFEFYKNEYNNIDDATYKDEINEKIDFYWKQGKIDFDYAEFKKEMI